MNVFRLSAGLAIAVIGVYWFAIVPLRVNIAIRQFENATDGALESPEEHSHIIARKNLQALNPWRRRSPLDIDLAMVEGANAQIIGDYSRAIAAYQRALMYDRRPEIYFNLAMAEAAAGDHDVAAADLARAIHFAPNIAEKVADPVLRNNAVSILRHGRAAPPWCCATDYDRDGSTDAIRVSDGAVISGRDGRTLFIVQGGTGWQPEFAAWDGSFTDVLMHQAATGDAAMWTYDRAGHVIRRTSLPRITHGWRAVCEANFGAETSSLMLASGVTSGTQIATPAGAPMREVPSLTEENAYIVGCGDFDRDHCVDVVFRSWGGGQFVWLLDGIRRRDVQVLPTYGFEWDVIGVSDSAGGGDPSLLWYNYNSDAVYEWEMKGTRVAGITSWPHTAH